MKEGLFVVIISSPVCCGLCFIPTLHLMDCNSNFLWSYIRESDSYFFQCVVSSVSLHLNSTSCCWIMWGISSCPGWLPHPGTKSVMPTFRSPCTDYCLPTRLKICTLLQVCPGLERCTWVAWTDLQPTVAKGTVEKSHGRPRWKLLPWAWNAGIKRSAKMYHAHVLWDWFHSCYCGLHFSLTPLFGASLVRLKDSSWVHWYSQSYTN